MRRPLPAQERPTDPDDFKRGPYDLEPLSLAAAPPLDGYIDDWPHEPAAWQSFARDATHQFSILTGVHERMLYVLLDVHDQHPLFDAAGNNTLDPGHLRRPRVARFRGPAGRTAARAARCLRSRADHAPGASSTGEYGRQSVGVRAAHPRRLAARRRWLPRGGAGSAVDAGQRASACSSMTVTRAAACP